MEKVLKLSITKVGNKFQGDYQESWLNSSPVILFSEKDLQFS